MSSETLEMIPESKKTRRQSFTGRHLQDNIHFQFPYFEYILLYSATFWYFITVIWLVLGKVMLHNDFQITG